MAVRQRPMNVRREWPDDGARGAGDAGFRPIDPMDQHLAPGDETILSPETMVDGWSSGMTVGSRPGGGYIVAYEWDSNHRINIWAYDGAGNLAWNNQVVTTLPREFDGSVTGLVGGGGVLVWAGPPASNTANEIFFLRFSSSGATIGSPSVVNTLAGRNDTHPRVVPLDNGGFVVVWGAYLNNNDADVFGQIYNSAGAAVGGNFQISTLANSFEYFPVIDTLPDGGFVVAWFSQANLSAPFQSRAQRFSAAGQKIGPEVLVSDHASGQMDIAALSDGGYVVAWHSNNATLAPEGAGGRVLARRFGPDGTPYPEGEITVISTATGRIGSLTGAGNVSVEGLDSNYFLVTWIDARPAVSTVFGRVYNAVGQSPSGVFVANQTTNKDHLLSDGAAVLIGNDTVALAWDGRPESSDLINVYTRRYAFEIPDPIVGTAGPDTLNGTALSDFMQGLAGADTLNGGAGADWMAGGAGNDTYFVDNAIDRAMENPGEGSDAVYASVSHALAAGSEIEVLSAADPSATTAINLTGNGLSQYISGNAGANILIGDAGDDVLEGRDGDDLLDGGEGSDNLVGAAGSDYMNGGAGADYAEGGDGNDAAEGFAGNDILFGNAGNDNLIGGDGDDYLNGGVGTDYFEGGSGNDAVEGGDNDDIAFGGDGNDNLLGQDGNDYLNGGAGLDYLVGGAGDDVAEGGADFDIFFGGEGKDVGLGGAGDDYLYGEAGDDILLGGDGVDYINGGAGGDYAEGGLGNDAIDGEAGNDILFGQDGNDNLLGGGDDDYLNGGIGADFLDGGAGNDAADGGAGNDILFGGDGDDNLIGGGEDDYLNGGIGTDYLEGGLGNDTLEGGAGADNMTGGDGLDTLLGGEGDDYAEGGTGDDTLFGNLGNDTLAGGGGADRFVFDSAPGTGNIDTIVDFTPGADKIHLDDAVFSGLAPGALTPGAFRIGTAAQDADDRIIYDSATGALLYDADGTGSGAAIQFATLSGAPTLTASDIIVF